jgi:hypothetical protein
MTFHVFISKDSFYSQRYRTYCTGDDVFSASQQEVFLKINTTLPSLLRDLRSVLFQGANLNFQMLNRRINILNKDIGKILNSLDAGEDRETILEQRENIFRVIQDLRDVLKNPNKIKNPHQHAKIVTQWSAFFVIAALSTALIISILVYMEILPQFPDYFPHLAIAGGSLLVISILSRCILSCIKKEPEIIFNRIASPLQNFLNRKFNYNRIFKEAQLQFPTNTHFCIILENINTIVEKRINEPYQIETFTKREEANQRLHSLSKEFIRITIPTKETLVPRSFQKGRGERKKAQTLPADLSI